MKRHGTLRRRLGTHPLAAHLKPGLRALGRHKEVVVRASRQLATDSLSFDEATPGSPTFDYLIGVPAAAVALEVHPAQTHELKRVAAKKRRTLALLSTCSVQHWCWAPTNGVHLPRTTYAQAFLAENGIDWPLGQIDLRRLG